jgi:hypothetical protein
MLLLIIMVNKHLSLNSFAGNILAYGLGYDWSKGFEEAGNFGSELFLTYCPTEDIERRKSKR